jgi:hypothetical protein
MTKSTFLQLLKLRLGSRTDTDLDTLISLEADQAQFELEHTGEPPWFLLSFGVPMTMTAGVRTVSWPSNFLAEYEDGGCWLTNSSGDLVRLDKGDYDESLAYYGTEEGQPVGYSTAGTAMQLFPIPDVVYPLSVDCFLADTPFSATANGSANAWLSYAADVLLAKTGVRVALFIRDVELVQVFAGELAAAIKRMETEHIARMEINRNRTMEV